MLTTVEPVTDGDAFEITVTYDEPLFRRVFIDYDPGMTRWFFAALVMIGVAAIALSLTVMPNRNFSDGIACAFIGGIYLWMKHPATLARRWSDLVAREDRDRVYRFDSQGFLVRGKTWTQSFEWRKLSAYIVGAESLLLFIGPGSYFVIPNERLGTRREQVHSWLRTTGLAPPKRAAIHHPIVAVCALALTIGFFWLRLNAK